MTQGKKISDSVIIGDHSIAAIHNMVVKMKHVWREWNGSTDAGIDGSIELRDPLTGEVSNQHILVQSKSTNGLFPGEDDKRFHFICSDRDVDYWMKAKEPVILICSHPDTGEAWWVHVQPWFADPGHRAARRVDFNKATDAFTGDISTRLFAVADPHGRAHTPVPSAMPESLVTNLLPVDLPDVYYSARTSITKMGDVLRAQRRTKHPVRLDFVLANGRIYTWRPVAGTALAEVPYEAVRQNPVGDLAGGGADTHRLLVRMLGQALQEDLGDELFRWNDDRRFLHYRATPDKVQKKVASTTGRPRSVFKGYPKKSDPSQMAYYRHSALKWRFLDLDGDWYCAITPDYFFSRDGVHESKYADEQLAGIKRLDKNQAVLGETRAWAAVLRSQETLLGDTDRILTFGDLLEVKVDRGIRDDDWKPVAEAVVSTEQDALFDMFGEL